MSAGEKITARHLERRALIYIRQSTPTQVIANRESTERQYALANEARALGWHDDLIETVDADQGRSGSFAGERDGFSRLADAVARGRVGAVFGLEVSRLARNPVEWFQLLDWCRMTDTLLVEGEQVYSPARHDDNLVLSIKGTLSESEAFLIRTRLQGGIRNKAARGELYHHIPIGYVLEGTSLLKDPDLQVRHAIDRVFSGFLAHGSAHQAIQALRDEGVRLPSRKSGSDTVVWSETRYERVYSILRNPAMGGAYVYGRQRTERVLGDDNQVRRIIRKVGPEDWHVLIKDHHEGYVPWPVWLEIQDQLTANSTTSGTGGAEREGKALLQGRVVCGHCGRAMSVAYGKAWSYICAPRNGDSGRRSCMTVGGKRIDALIGDTFLEAVSASGIEAAAEAFRQQQQKDQEAHRTLQLDVDRCNYEASLAERRYWKVDPDNRLVADTLERDWNRALEALAAARDALEQAQRDSPEPPPLTRLNALGMRLSRLWESPVVTARDRKRLLACLVEEVMLWRDGTAKVIRILVRWHGGATDEFELPSHQAPAVVRDDIDTVALVRRLAAHYPDARTATILNRQGRRTAKGLAFTAYLVRQLRVRNDIPAWRAERRDPDAPLLSVAEAARELQTTDGTLYRWIRAGIVPAEQPASGAPYRIRMTPELRSQFCDEPPAGFVSLHRAMKRLGVSRQVIWQRIRSGALKARHIRRGSVKGLYVQLGEDRLPLFETPEAGDG